jgi:hypothetical protein
MKITNPSQITSLSANHAKKSSSTSPEPFRPHYKKEQKGISAQLENAALLAVQNAIEDEKLLVEGVAPPPLMPLQGTLLPGTTFSLSAIRSAAIPPEMLEIFEKGVHAMTHLTISGVSETTFFLDTPQFSGAKIIITEFNTAPKTFNIALVGAPEMIALFNLHASDLITAFQKSPFNFTIHRIDSDIDLPKIERKEDISDQNEDEEKQ